MFSPCLFRNVASWCCQTCTRPVFTGWMSRPSLKMEKDRLPPEPSRLLHTKASASTVSHYSTNDLLPNVFLSHVLQPETDSVTPSPLPQCFPLIKANERHCYCQQQQQQQHENVLFVQYVQDMLLSLGSGSRLRKLHHKQPIIERQ